MNETLDELSYAGEEEEMHFPLEDITKRSQILIAVTIASILINLADLGLTSWILSILSPDITIGDWFKIDLMEKRLSHISKIVSVITTISFLRWILMANKNAHALKLNPALRYAPGMAVGSWFIPIAWWFIPYLSFAETWRASKTIDGNTSRREFNKLTLSSDIKAWWFLNVGFWVPLAIAVFYRIQSESASNFTEIFEQIQTGAYASILVNLMQIAAAIVLIKLVLEIKRLQTSRPEWVY